MKIKNFEQFLNESKVASDDSPLGFYTIANALSPENFFKALDELGIKYTHDKHANLITVSVKDKDQASMIRDLALSDALEADDIEAADLPYMTPEEIGDAMEIKLL